LNSAAHPFRLLYSENEEESRVSLWSGRIAPRLRILERSRLMKKLTNTKLARRRLTTELRPTDDPPLFT
jgi:hypothetical protein